MDLANLIVEATQLLDHRTILIERIEDTTLRASALQEQADEAASVLAAEAEAGEELDETLDSLRERIVDHPDARAADVLEIVGRLDEALKYRTEESEDDLEY